MVLTDFDQVTPDWLTGVLRVHGDLPQGEVTGVEKNVADTNTAQVAQLRLTYSDDAPEAAPGRLFLKFSDRRREVDFYRLIVPATADPPTLICYDAGYSEALNRAHLLLEDVSKTHAEPVKALPPTRPQYEAMLDVLACFHAQWWEHPRLSGDLADLGGAVRNFACSVAQEQFGSFVDFLDDRLSVARRKIYERVFAAWPPAPRAVRLRTGKALTITHGDAHAWNFMHPVSPEAGSLVIVDWAVWQVSVCTDDLAYMIAMHDYPDHRARMEKALVRTYYDRLLEYGVDNYEWDQCWLDYRISVIGNLFWPVFHWSVQGAPDLWWPNLERSLLAFEDLDCAELLG